MKMSHLYFDKYCTRNVQHEKAPGLFNFDGEVVSREYIDDSSKHRKVIALRAVTDHQKTLQQDIVADVAAISSTNERNRHEASGKKSLPRHSEELSEQRAQAIAHFKHIYYDDNFVRENEMRSDKVTTGGRVWLPSHKMLKFTEASQSNSVSTAKPPNSCLGLTPLRMYGGGQDKPHHMTVARNTERLKLK